jgi:SAM-dependent methyltransferase
LISRLDNEGIVYNIFKNKKPSHHSIIKLNTMNISIKAIDLRYSQLAETECCLSCGGAINYAKAQAGEVCVDLGSGKGNDVIRLAEKVGDNGFVYGVDISEGMIKKAKANAQKFEVSNVEFIQSELESINLPSLLADLVISNCTINHATNKQLVWNEIYRILKKDGRFVISDIYAIQAIPDAYKNNPEAVAECWAGAITKSEYLNILSIAGFKNIHIFEESKPYIKGKAEVCSFTISGSKL